MGTKKIPGRSAGFRPWRLASSDAREHCDEWGLTPTPMLEEALEEAVHAYQSVCAFQLSGSAWKEVEPEITRIVAALTTLQSAFGSAPDRVAARAGGDAPDDETQSERPDLEAHRRLAGVAVLRQAAAGLNPADFNAFISTVSKLQKAAATLAGAKSRKVPENPGFPELVRSLAKALRDVGVNPTVGGHQDADAPWSMFVRFVHTIDKEAHRLVDLKKQPTHNTGYPQRIRQALRS